MKFLKDISENENVVGHYLCKSKQLLKSRAGKEYISLKLQDKTAVVDAKIWNPSSVTQDFKENDFIKIDATSLIYNGEMQLNVKRLRKSEEGEYDPLNYSPSSEKDIDQMSEELYAYIDTISNPYIKKLLEKIFIEDEYIKKRFPRHSAARTMHHGFLGGLLEHTLSVTQICDFLAPRYKNVNRDMLIACAMLHDIGKLDELSSLPLNEYTDDGQLLGHIVIGTELVGKTADSIPDFPHRLRSLLQHCIIAHHGEYIFGSPQLPKTIEATILHLADNADAKIKSIEESFSAASENLQWIGYNRMLERNLSRSDF